MKHSHADQVSVKVWNEDDQLAIEILDNGNGIAATPGADSPGVRKLQDRARTLHGLFRVKSNKEYGTRIQLFVKHSHLSTQPAI
jgi:signal transduction histidine kinase